MNTNVKKVVLKYSLFTAIAVILAFVLAFLALFFFAPKVIAKFSQSLGFNNISLYYYEKHYHEIDDSDLNDLYNIIILASLVEKYDKVDRYYERITQKDNYDEFIEFMDNAVLYSDYNISVKSLLYNTRNYLQKEYVNALIKTDKTSIAVLFAYNNFKDFQEYSLKEPGTYLFEYFFKEQLLSDVAVSSLFNQNYSLTGKKLSENIGDYLNNINQLFDNLNNETNSEDYIYYLYLQDRANVIAQNLIFYNNLNGAELPPSNITNSQINSLMANINGKVRDYIFA